MVLELMTGGELFEKIAMDGPLSEGAGRRVFQQLLDGLAYCHAQGVYHRRAHRRVKGVEDLADLKNISFLHSFCCYADTKQLI